MSKIYLKYTSLAIFYLLLFLGSFRLLQKDHVYQKTLGRISSNYVNAGEYSEWNIINKKIPYLEITSENLTQWDAVMFNCIRLHGYELNKDVNCANEVRAGFFPLLPLAWKLSGLDSIGICLFNFAIYCLALVLFIENFLLRYNEKNRFILFLLGMSLPFSVIFYIPYSESLFFLSVVISFIGLKKNSYLLFFVGSFLAITARPASAFLAIAYFIFEFLILIKERQFSRSLIRMIKDNLPYILGWITVILFQFYYTGSFNSFFEARAYWPEESQGMRLPKSIYDWSVEGFGMSVAAIFFLVVPSIFIFIRWLLNKDHLDKITGVSTIYFILLFIYTLLYRNGSLNSFYRYTFCTPMLLILLIKMNHFVVNHQKVWRNLIFSCLVLLPLFLIIFGYGGSRWNFRFFGLYLLIGHLALLSFRTVLSKRLITLLLLFLLSGGLIWTTYLLNMYMSNAWIFA